jgi:WD40 repeat protein
MLLWAEPGPIWAAAFSPDSKTVLVDRDLRDARSGKLLAIQLKRSIDRVVSAAFSPDAQSLAVADLGVKAQVWDTATGRPRARPVSHTGSIHALFFSRDSRSLLTVSVDTTARLWDVATGRPLGPLLKYHSMNPWDSGFRTDGPIPGTTSAVALAPDGRTVVLVNEPGRQTDNWNKVVTLRDAATGAVRGQPMVHPEPVQAVAITRDGKIVLTLTADGTLRTWDAATGAPRETSPSLGKSSTVAFHPDDRAVLTLAQDGVARLWDAATGQRLGPLLSHEGGVTGMAFSPDGQTILTLGRDKRVRLWDISDLPDDPTRVATWLEVLTGLRVDDLGQAHVLSNESWRERRDRLQGDGGFPKADRKERSWFLPFGPR